MEQIHGITLLVSKFKDNDSILNVISEKGPYAILGKGILNYKSKNFKFSHAFIECDLEIYKGKIGGYKLKDGRICQDFTSLNYDYNFLVYLDFISELTLKTVDGIDNYEKLFIILKITLENLKSGLSQLAYYLLVLLDLLGIKPDCGDGFKYYFDIQNGNFTDFESKNTILFSVDDYNFIKNVIDNDLIVCNNANFHKIIYCFYLFLNQKMGVKLNSIDYFVKY
ncbi:MAG: DNA repair protein RecO C-terminal domain-containing protein [Candidatus Onthovivens sp.]|nr:DNA repair protein RecO C-terminal domain-containing protein [Candidatus Onthovivens sp.]